MDPRPTKPRNSNKKPCLKKTREHNVTSHHPIKFSFKLCSSPITLTSASTTNTRPHLFAWALRLPLSATSPLAAKSEIEWRVAVDLHTTGWRPGHRLRRRDSIKNFKTCLHGRRVQNYGSAKRCQGQQYVCVSLACSLASQSLAKGSIPKTASTRARWCLSQFITVKLPAPPSPSKSTPAHGCISLL